MESNPTPLQLKIDGMPETEVLRIEGSVTVLKDVNLFEEDFNAFMRTRDYQWAGTISPLNPDAESFMVEVPKDDWKLLKDTCNTYREMVDQLNNKIQANNLAYSDLAEQLRQEKESKDRWKRALELETKISSNRLNKIGQQEDQLIEKDLVIKSLRNKKDSPIKAGLKRAWKWLVKNFTKNQSIEGPSGLNQQ